MVEAGATRIGASASVKILEQARAAAPSEAAPVTAAPIGSY
jgi:deoxyribose-phosphate aldolase